MTTNRRTVSWPATAVAAVLAAALAGAIAFAVAGLLSGDSTRPSAGELPTEEPGGTPALQAAILADGVVTRAEDESSVQATVGCLAERGFEVTPRDQGDGWLTWSFTTSSSSEGSRYQAAARECRKAFADEVNAAYLAARATGPSKADQARAEIARCLTRRGVSGVPTDAPIRRMLDLLEAAGLPGSVFDECRQAALDTFGVVPAQ
ncbi:MAG: hypothetical protein HY875_13190 [Chloroflexi bacterium]|nr:hypothetical protein [Chloroflexota bacterium]